MSWFWKLFLENGEERRWGRGREYNVVLDG